MKKLITKKKRKFKSFKNNYKEDSIFISFNEDSWSFTKNEIRANSHVYSSWRIGGTNGLVSIEDLVEEIVGEIKDEHDFEEIEEIKKISKKTYDVSARLPVEDLEKKIGGYFTDEEKEDIDTVGGLVFNLLGKIPSRGEVISHKSGLEFTIRDADTRKIKRILVNVK